MKTNNNYRVEELSLYHPTVNLIYFAAVLALCMVRLHPLVLTAGLLGSAGYLIYLRGWRAWGSIAFAFVSCVCAAAFNVLFNHRGETVLCYLKSGNPLTLESITYGGALGASFACMLLWFACFNAVMTSDRLMCLIGRLSPRLSVLLTVVLRFIPLYMRLIRKAIADRHGFYGDMPPIKRGLKAIEAVTGQALENAIASAEVMQGRGLGLGGRTAFTPFSFKKRDGIMLAVLILLCLACFTLAPTAQYLPHFTAGAISPIGVLAVLALTLLPLALNLFRRLI
jgi:energy-coupling factor transport system permease protein